MDNQLTMRLTAARRRRADLDGSIIPAALPLPGDVDDEPPTTPGRRIRLSKSQQRLLVSILAINDDLREARLVLAEEDADFPVISDRALRWYRQRICDGDPVFADWVREARAAVFQSGFSLRSVRVEALRGIYRRLTEREIRTTDTVTWLQIVREKTRILDRISLETASFEPGSPGRPGRPPAAPGEGGALEDGLPDLQEVLRQLFEDQQAMSNALVGAQRPTSLESQ